jgi:DNA-binding GntR family transcriptional regulator
MPIPEVTPKLARRTIRDEIYPTVREWIITGVLHPGEVLKDQELAQKLGVSRTPVREALQRLRDEGFVQTESNRWTRVAPIDPGAVAEIYQIVRALESEVLLVAGFRLTDRDIEAMAKANERLRAALEGRKGLDASHADSQFHDVFVHRCGNGHLIRIMDDLRLKLRRAEIVYFDDGLVAAASVAEHEQVVAALQQRDYERAAAAIRTNWDGSLERLTSSLAPKEPLSMEVSGEQDATGK